MKWNVLPSKVSLTLTDAAYRVIEIPVLPAVLGRRGSDIVVEHPSISPEHAVLHTVDGCIAIRDLDSRNGTLVNGKVFQGEIILKNGDEITLGAVFFRVGLEVKHKTAAPKPDGEQQFLGQTVPLRPENGINPNAHVRPVFLIVSSGGKRREFLLSKTVSTIGRKDGDIRVADPSLSRKHFQVEIHDDHVCIKDLASANGTYVNGTPISYFRALDAVTFTAGGSTFQLVTGPRRG